LGYENLILHKGQAILKGIWLREPNYLQGTKLGCEFSHRSQAL